MPTCVALVALAFACGNSSDKAGPHSAQGAGSGGTIANGGAAGSAPFEGGESGGSGAVATAGAGGGGGAANGTAGSPAGGVPSHAGATASGGAPEPADGGSGGMLTEIFPSCSGSSGDECQGESCCAVITLAGGTFPMGRSTDGSDAFPSDFVNPDEQPEHAATVSAFALDKYEVTVGRFRRFVTAFSGPPPVDAGAHPAHAFSGWQPAWNGKLPADKFALAAASDCDDESATWTNNPGAQETLPINCMSWHLAFAFCVWDGGRLPSEAEWEYAAAGGEQNRRFPWGNPTPDRTLAVYSPEGLAAVGSHTAGKARWGHEDMAGNLSEWVFDEWDEDWYGAGGGTCSDCANLDLVNGGNLIKGGDFSRAENWIRNASRRPADPSAVTGIRCARNLDP